MKLFAIIFRLTLFGILRRMLSLSRIDLVMGQGLILLISLICFCISRIFTFFSAFFIIELVIRYFLLIKFNLLFRVCFTFYFLTIKFCEEPFIYFNFVLRINFKSKRKLNFNPLITKKYFIDVIFAKSFIDFIFVKSFIEVIYYYQHIIK